MIDLEKIKARRSVSPPSLWCGVSMTPVRTSDLDALIAEVERLRGERETISKHLCRVLIHPEFGKYAPKDMDSLLAGVAELRAENKQLRSDSCVSGANAAAAWFKALAERDEANANAARLRREQEALMRSREILAKEVRELRVEVAAYGKGTGRPVGTMPLETRPDKHTDGYDGDD